MELNDLEASDGPGESELVESVWWGDSRQGWAGYQDVKTVRRDKPEECTGEKQEGTGRQLQIQ